MRILVFFIFLLCFYNLRGQEVYLDFDNCLISNSGSLPDPTATGENTCECGVQGESLELPDLNSSLEFDSSYTAFFQEDFTLSFEFMLQSNASGIQDIFSVSTTCRTDSSLTIKYIAQESIIRVQMSRDFGLFIELDAQINTDMCWHQLVLVRDNENYFLYVDGQFAEEGFTNGTITLDPSGVMRFANSPCQAFGESPFRGRIDEFKIYDRPLSVEEIFSNYQRLDVILTRDTTIFSGNVLNVNATESCAENITWTPSTNVNPPDVSNPQITPESSTQFTVNFDYGICRGVDSLNVAIIDADAVECDNLLVPNAFTPNNDGLNDGIGISNTFIVEELRDFEIFDRWGEKVFSTTIVTEQWDGSVRNQKLNSNVFLYKVNYTCKGEEFIKTGSFSILR